jgi:hypothetical protein
MIILPDEKSTIPKMYIPVIIIKTTSRIDKERGHRIFSIAFINGDITNPSSTAMVKGRITVEANFNTAAAKITQIKTIKKKTARPE